jgi:hypothetical protein
MAFDEGLAQRLREALAEQGTVTEKRMFGGLAFMVGGHMCAGIVGDELMVRVGAAAEPALLRQPHARPMDFTGRPLRGFLFVASPGIAADDALREWLARGLAFVRTLPARHLQDLQARPRVRRSGAPKSGRLHATRRR